MDYAGVSVWAFGSALFLVGGGLLWLSFGKFGEMLLSVNETLRCWGRLLSQAPCDAQLVETDPMFMRVRVPSYSIYHWGPDGLEIGSVQRVHVALDVIARLSRRNQWQKDQSRLLDDSAICLLGEGKGEEVEMLARGRRIWLTYTDSGMRSRDDYVLNCNLAVHVWVDLPLYDEEKLNRLFDNFRHFNDALRNGIRGVLSSEFRSRTYRDAMYDVPRIVSVLRKHWESSQQFVPFQGLIHVEFTGLVVMPRIEAEMPELQRLAAGRIQLEEKIAKHDKKIANELLRWQHDWDDLRKKTRDALVSLKVGNMAAIKASGEGLVRTMSNMSQVDTVIKGADALFDGAQKQLSSSTLDVEKVFREMAAFIRKLAEVNTQLMAELRKMRNTESGRQS